VKNEDARALDDHTKVTNDQRVQEKKFTFEAPTCFFPAIASNQRARPRSFSARRDFLIVPTASSPIFQFHFSTLHFIFHSICPSDRSDESRLAPLLRKSKQDGIKRETRILTPDT
jgi:hypothetical protein